MKKLFKFLSLALASVALLLPSASAVIPEHGDLENSRESRERFAEEIFRQNTIEFDQFDRAVVRMSREDKENLKTLIQTLNSRKKYSAVHLVWCLINHSITYKEDPSSVDSAIKNYWKEFLKYSCFEESKTQGDTHTEEYVYIDDLIKRDFQDVLRECCHLEFFQFLDSKRRPTSAITLCLFYEPLGITLEYDFKIRY